MKDKNGCNYGRNNTYLLNVNSIQFLKEYRINTYSIVLIDTVATSKRVEFYIKFQHIAVILTYHGFLIEALSLRM